MKSGKRILATVICVIIILCSLPLTSSAAAISGFNVINFTVPANTDAGLGVTLKVFRDVAGSNRMVIALPDGIDTSASKLKLAWDHTGDITVKSGSSSGTTVTSGNVSIPSPGSSITLNVSASIRSGSRTSTQNQNFTFTTAKRSADVKSIFINIDETVKDASCTGTETCTIDRMNGDISYHEKTCYGSFEFDGKKYYLSMKGRGNYTWSNCDKKPYNFTTYKDATWDDKKKTSLIDGVESKKWSLLANYADSTLLRNKIAYDIADDLGIGLKSRFVDVWMNGQYLGNYLLTPKTDYDAPDEGYMLELDNKKENLPVEQGGDPQFTLANFKEFTDGSNHYNTFTVKDIGTSDIKKEDITPIKNWMETAVNAVMGTSDDYLKYIDVDSWAKMYLLQELYKNYDIISGSLFMYRNGLGENDKLIAGPVWDMDNAFGRQQTCGSCGVSNEIQRSSHEWYIDSINSVQSFLQYLGKHSEFMERVYQVYNEYKSDFDNIPTNLQNQKNSITDSRILNFQRWSVNQTQYNVSRYTGSTAYASGTDYATTMKVTSSYDDYFTNLNTYLTTRLKWFADKLTVTAVPTCTVSGETAFSAGDTLALTATATNADAYSWQYSSDGVIWNTISGETSKTYSTTVTADMDKWQYRCVAKKNGNDVTTTNKRVAQVKTSTVAYGNAAALHIHKFEDAVTAPTCTEKGYTTHICTDCDFTCNDTYTDATGHTDTNRNNICDVCREIIDKTVTTYSEEWNYNGTHHWHDVIWGNAEDVSGFAAHTFNEGKKTGSSITYTCTECGYKYAIILGDGNGDGKINAEDLGALRSALLTDAEYSEVFDYNGDGAVDIRDLVRLKKHLVDNTVPLGKNCVIIKNMLY